MSHSEPPTVDSSDDSSSGLPDARPEAKSEKQASDEAMLAPVRKSMPAWLVSMIIHIIFLLTLVLWTMPIGEGISRIVLEFGEAVEEESLELEEFSLETAKSEVRQEDADAELPKDVDVQSLMETVKLSEPVKTVLVDIGGQASELVVKPMFSGRTGAMKSALLAMYGGNKETMDAVERGLRWLARQQDTKGTDAGSWSMRGPFDDGSLKENRVAATAMALLAFQGDGNTHLGGPYKTVVAKGLKFLLKSQSRSDGFFARQSPYQEKAYSHAQATIAICELYAMTKDSSLRASAEAAIDYALKAQSSEGGWRYKPRQDSDLSVTGWYVLALKSAESAGLKVPHSIFSIIHDYVESLGIRDGAGYVYKKGRPGTPAMTAEGLLCRQYLGWPHEEEAMALGLETLVVDWPLTRSDMNVYHWYYSTQALHHYGGSLWVRWNANMKVKLPRMQIKRGRESGSWSPQADEWGRNAGRLFTTCLSIYCLEVYYRHLPLYKAAEGK